MRRRLGCWWQVIGLVAAMATSGCLVAETDTTVTIDPDGSGTWTVVDRDVHSTAETPEERAREEQDFLDKASSGRLEAAAALETIGCAEVTTRVTRREWPFAAITECRFSNIATLWKNLLERSGLRGESSLETAGGRTTWRLSVDTGPDQQGNDDDRDTPAEVLLGGREARYFLRDGRFVEAAGFDLADDDRVGTMKATPGDEPREGGGVVRLLLSWAAAAR